MTELPYLLSTYLVSAGIMLCAGVLAALLRFVGRQPRNYLAFAAASIGAAGYQFCTAAYYVAGSVESASSALHVQMLFLCLACVSLFYFFSHYARGSTDRRSRAVVALVFGAMVLLDWLKPYGLRFEHLDLAAPLQLPWGEALGHVRGRADPLTRTLVFGPVFGLVVWSLRLARQLHRDGDRGIAVSIMVWAATMAVAGIWGALIDSGVVHSFYLAGFAFVGLVVLMGVTLARKQASTFDALREERDRLNAAQAALEFNELRLRLVLTGTNDACWDWNILTGEEWYSPRGWEMLGYAPGEEVSGSLWEAQLHPDDRERCRRIVYEAIATGSGRDHYSFEARLLRKDGSSLPVLARGYILRDAEGRATRVSGTDTDLSEQKRAEAALQRERELNEQIIAQSPVGISIFDAQGQCVAANAAIATITGMPVEQLLQQNLHEIPSWRNSGMYALALRTLHTEAPSSELVRVQTAGGRDVRAMVNFRILPREGIGRLMLMVDDLSDYHRAEQERRALQESYEMLFNRSMDGVMQARPDGTVLAANPALCAMLGMSEEEMRQRGRNGLLDTTDPRLAPLLEQRARTGHVRGELRMIRGDGERFEVEVSSAIYSDREGRPLTSTMVRDITERKQAEANTYRLAYFDELTGLPNRRFLTDRIREATETAHRTRQNGALLFLDLDNFKRLNDARGHSVGDALLGEVARRISQLLRNGDMVARLGGDEFIVLAAQLGHEPEGAARAAMAIAERVRAVLEAPYLIDGYLYSGTGSIGLTLFPKENEGVEDLLREADTAMYRAKSTGRNRIAFFESGMQREVEERLGLEQDLKDAIGTGQICVHVQPQFDRAGVQIGGELLLRWNHPQRGAISPEVFIPIAEESGLILRLGDYVVEAACEALARLPRSRSHLSVSVNISPRQFRQEDFVARTRALLDRTGAPAGRLVFEVTEGLLIDNWEDVAARMTELAALGIRISIDDFGTGYSSLSYLKKLPLHELKIDKSFVQNTPDDPNGRAIVRSILAVAKAFKLTVIAEGVETQSQSDFLTQLECHGLQGFFLARPMPLEAWMAQDRTPVLPLTSLRPH